MQHPWRQTYSPALSPTRPYPCIGRRSGGRIPSPSVWFFRNVGRCRKWLWRFVPHLCPSGQDCLGTGLSGRTAGEVQLGRVGISPEGGSWTESEGKAVGERRGKPRLPRGFGLSGLRDRTRLPGLYPKAFRMPSLREPSRFSGQGLSGT